MEAIHRPHTMFKISKMRNPNIPECVDMLEDGPNTYDPGDPFPFEEMTLKKDHPIDESCIFYNIFIQYMSTHIVADIIKKMKQCKLTKVVLGYY